MIGDSIKAARRRCLHCAWLYVAQNVVDCPVKLARKVSF